jgi:hypothetical protein
MRFAWDIMFRRADSDSAFTGPPTLESALAAFTSAFAVLIVTPGSGDAPKGGARSKRQIFDASNYRLDF